MIDTEHGSASKYADLFPPFDCVNLETFHPDLYIEAIKAAEHAGYAVLIIDSLSHAWNGKGGLLELVDAIAKRAKSGNTYVAWAEATPIQNRLIDTHAGSQAAYHCHHAQQDGICPGEGRADQSHDHPQAGDGADPAGRSGV